MSTLTTLTWVANTHSPRPTPPQLPSSTRLSTTIPSHETRRTSHLEGLAMSGSDPASIACAAPATAHAPPSKQVVTSPPLLTFLAWRAATPPMGRIQERVATTRTAPAYKSTIIHTHENLRRAGDTMSARISGDSNRQCREGMECHLRPFIEKENIGGNCDWGLFPNPCVFSLPSLIAARPSLLPVGFWEEKRTGNRENLSLVFLLGGWVNGWGCVFLLLYITIFCSSNSFSLRFSIEEQVVHFSSQGCGICFRSSAPRSCAVREYRMCVSVLIFYHSNCSNTLAS
jgi:hypothetical protein